VGRSTAAGAATTATPSRAICSHIPNLKMFTSTQPAAADRASPASVMAVGKECAPVDINDGAMAALRKRRLYPYDRGRALEPLIPAYARFRQVRDASICSDAIAARGRADLRGS